MATNSDLISITKALVYLLEETTKRSASTSVSTDISSTENSLYQEEQMSQSTLEDSLAELPSLIKEQSKVTRDLISERIDRLEERLKSLEDVVIIRFGRLDTKVCSPKEFKCISERITRLEDGVCTSKDLKGMIERLPCSEGDAASPNYLNLRDIKDRLSAIEKNMSASEEVKYAERKFEGEDEVTSSGDCKGTDKSLTALQIREDYSTKTPKLHSVFKGKNIKLTNHFRSAERTKPLEDSGTHGSVVSQKILSGEEVFQFRIEETVDCYEEYGFGIGVIEDPGLHINTSRSIFYHVKGTWAIRSQSSSSNGYSNTYKDGNLVNNNGYRMDTRHLPVGTIIGVSRKENGGVHFYLNGIDQGAAFEGVPEDVHAFIDILYYVTKISIVE